MLSLNRGFFARTGETDVEAVEALEATLALFADGEDGGTKAALLAALASELVWAEDGDRRFALSDEALAMARRASDPRALARVLGLRNMTILAPDTLQERTANCYELLGLAEEVQDDTDPLRRRLPPRRHRARSRRRRRRQRHGRGRRACRRPACVSRVSCGRRA